MENYKEKIDRALDFYEQGRGQEAAMLLSGIWENIPPSDGSSLGLVGSILRNTGETAIAVRCFEKLVYSAPLSPRASLGLFHSLWRGGRCLVALDELERFYSLSKKHDNLHSLNGYGEHNRLLEEMGDSYFEDNDERPSDPFEIIQRFRTPFES